MLQIGKTSSLVLTLAGILKAILLVAFSVVFRAEHISPLQFAGYAVALFGLVYYSLGREQLKTLASTTKDWVSDDTKVSPAMRRAVAVAALVLVALVVLVGLRGGSGGAVETPDAEGWGFSWMSKLGWGS